MTQAKVRSFPAAIDTGDAALQGDVVLPRDARGIVLFAHGSGSSRFSTRNRYVASQIVEGGLGTFLFDLLTAEEEVRDRRDASLRFDIDLLTRRLAGATRWLGGQDWATNLRRGYFGASTGAAAALAASVEMRSARDRVEGRAPGPRRRCPAPRDRADTADRRLTGSRGHRVERAGAATPALRGATRDRSRCNPPVRGAGHARTGGHPGAAVVPPLAGLTGMQCHSSLDRAPSRPSRFRHRRT